MAGNNGFIPFALPDIGQSEIDEVIDTLRSGWLTTGPKTKQFETNFAKLIGTRFALALNSATAGLHLALEAIGIKPGDRVITSVYTFTATAEVIRYLGADPVFVDIDPRTMNLDINQLEKTLEEYDNIKAIVPVHFAGQSCDMEKIMRFSRRHQLGVVEDAAHALPTTFKGKLIGNHGDMTVYSFYATKSITTGEGGMVVGNNEAYRDRIRVMRLHGINNDVFDRYTTNKPKWHYEVVEPGFKYNMTDMAASLGIHQLKKVYDFQKKRERIAAFYTREFAGLPLKTPHISQPEDLHAWHLYIIQLDLERLTIDRNRFIELMAESGIGTSVHFIPLHLQPYWRDRYGYSPEDFPAALDIFQRSVSLPIYSRMSDTDMERVVKAVREIFLKHGK